MALPAVSPATTHRGAGFTRWTPPRTPGGHPGTPQVILGNSSSFEKVPGTAPAYVKIYAENAAHRLTGSGVLTVTVRRTRSGAYTDVYGTETIPRASPRNPGPVRRV
ncbi:hypothetical protein ACIHCM_06390 [Streptomyces sp. NPDC052023]|uniref:hypothetical protein n=1 Tax=Streptomyces sp. NPDC052023 TaxID=3365681 RepID=UPI0037CF4383